MHTLVHAGKTIIGLYIPTESFNNCHPVGRQFSSPCRVAVNVIMKNRRVNQYLTVNGKYKFVVLPGLWYILLRYISFYMKVENFYG